MTIKSTITEHELELRAQYLSYFYGLKKKDVVAILHRTKVTITDVVMNDFFTYYKWFPSLKGRYY